jgi:hypothetical protein
VTVQGATKVVSTCDQHVAVWGAMKVVSTCDQHVAVRGAMKVVGTCDQSRWVRPNVNPDTHPLQQVCGTLPPSHIVTVTSSVLSFAWDFGIGGGQGVVHVFGCNFVWDSMSAGWILHGGQGFNSG